MKNKPIATITFSGLAIEINITQDDINVIARKYNGDYIRYIDLNIRGLRNVEWEEQGDFLELEKALNFYEISELKRALSNKIFTKRTLETYLITNEQYASLKIKEDIKNTLPLIDRNILKQALEYADETSIKAALSCIYFDKDNIVATDTKRLICIKNNSEIRNTLIPKAFCLEYIKNQEAIIFTIDNLVFLQSGDRYYCALIDDTFSFPDYKRIMEFNKYYMTIGKEVFLTNSSLYREEGECGVIAQLRAFETTDDTIWIYEDEIPQFDYKRVVFSDCQMPIMFENDEIKVVMLPLFVDEDFIKTLKKEKI